ncbi:MAG TPA: diguanylate cyclase [Sedimenticola sp.]|nr:diguanylate cyclase [Sedimenticola sp.]
MSQNNIAEQEWFQLCPAGLLALDSGGHIRGINSAMEEMTGVSAEQLLDQAPDGLSSSIRRLLGDQGLVHLQGPDRERWLQRETRELGGPGDEKTILHFYLDVTEAQQLRQENERLLRHIDELSITDELTGLANRQTLTRMLESQVARSRRYQNPLSMALAEVIPGDGRTHSLPRLPDELIVMVSGYLRDRLRWADVLGRWDQTRFMLLLPETPGEAARTLIDNIGHGVSDIATAEGTADPAFRLRFGLVEWSKGLDARKLIRQAEQALDAAGTSAAAGC